MIKSRTKIISISTKILSIKRINIRKKISMNFKEISKAKKNDNCLFYKKFDHRVNDCNNLKFLSNENEIFNSKN